MTYLRVKNKTIRQKCIEMGVPYMTIWYYMQKGYSFDEAVKQRGNGGRPKPKFFYKGQTLCSYCRENGLDYYQVYLQMYYHHISEEEAIKKIKGKSK